MRSRRSMKLLIGSLVMAFACVCCSTTDVTIEDVASDQQELRDGIASPFLEDFLTENFDLSRGTATTYNKFILNIRNGLTGPASPAKFGIPMMRAPAAISNSNRFLLVKLSNHGKETTLAVRVSDGYVVGYCCGKNEEKTNKRTSWFFKDTVKQEKDLLFIDTVKKDLGFDGNYKSLGDRDNTSLGRGPMGTSIENLAKTDGKNRKDVKKAALVLIQMVCEATRYKYISDKVADYVAVINKSFIPDNLMLDYQNNWGQLSEAVATANITNGAFKKTVVMKTANITNVSQIKDRLSLLKFVKT